MLLCGTVLEQLSLHSSLSGDKSGSFNTPVNVNGP